VESALEQLVVRGALVARLLPDGSALFAATSLDASRLHDIWRFVDR
jgi:hypothetical protein